MSMKIHKTNYTYEGLLEGLRKRPTLAGALDEIRKDFKVKLPDRSAIKLWNSPELGDFRGFNEDLHRHEEMVSKAHELREEIKQKIRDRPPSPKPPYVPPTPKAPGAPPGGLPPPTPFQEGGSQGSSGPPPPPPPLNHH